MSIIYFDSSVSTKKNANAKVCDAKGKRTELQNKLEKIQVPPHILPTSLFSFHTSN